MSSVDQKPNAWKAPQHKKNRLATVKWGVKKGDRQILSGPAQEPPQAARTARHQILSPVSIQTCCSSHVFLQPPIHD